MAKKLDPLISEDDSPETPQPYDAAFEARAQQALHGPWPVIPHDEMMAEIDASIDDMLDRKARLAAGEGVEPDPEIDGPTDPDEYDAWCDAQVQAAIDDPRPFVPHDEVVAYMQAFFDRLAERTKPRT